MKKLLFLGLVVCLMVTPVMSAKPVQLTGFDVVMEGYGLELIDYDITSKFKFTNDDQYAALEVMASDDYGNIYNFYWIMKKERYNELKEKV